MLLLFLATQGCAVHTVAPPNPETSGPAAGEILLLHTNDIHGHFLPEEAKWLDGEPEIGGFAAIDEVVNQAEQVWGRDRVLLVDGGDLSTGTPLSDLHVRGSQGGAMLEFLEAIGYDAWVLGNHEFDKGFENIEAMVQASQVPVISSNLHSPDGGLALKGQLSSTIVKAGGVTVGLIGATTTGLDHLASPATMARIVVKDPIETVQAEIDRLDPLTDLLVVVSHIGLPADRALAQGVVGLDVIVGGHSHTRLEQFEIVNDVYILQAGSYGRSIGEARLQVKDDAIAAFEWRRKDLVADDERPPASADVTALVGKYEQMIEAEFGTEIAKLDYPMERSSAGASTLGNWITSQLRHATKSDVGLYNAGGIRADFSKGPITRGDVFQVFPFSNAVVQFEVTGSELLGIVLDNLNNNKDGKHGVMQTSGIRLTWQERLGSPEVVSFIVNGKAFSPEQTYTVATNSYVVEQAEKYLGGAVPKNPTPQGMTVYELALLAMESGRVQLDSSEPFQKVE